MGDVATLRVRLEQGPDQEHRGAGRADEARRHRAGRDEGRVDRGRGLQVPLDPHASGDAVEREQEDDERHVLREDRIDEHGAGDGPGRPRGGWRRDRMRGEVQVDRLAMDEEIDAEGDRGERRGDEQLARVVLPPVRYRRRERQHGDRREKHDERQDGPGGGCGTGGSVVVVRCLTVLGVVACGSRVGVVPVGGRRVRCPAVVEFPLEQIAAILWPAEHRCQGIEGEQAEDPADHPGGAEGNGGGGRRRFVHDAGDGVIPPRRIVWDWHG